MKKYIKEILILLIQLFMFYVFPMFAGPTDAIGMVVIIIFATFILSFALGLISKNRVKFIYPIVIAVLFVPSVYIYYNETALIHAVWYIVISYMGMFSGSITAFILEKIAARMK